MIELFIENQKVDIPKDIDIKMTYQLTDIENPTAVKNNFSKTITLEGTPNNNDIFGNIYELDREVIEGDTLTGVYFDPRKRVPFKLFVDIDLYEAGYIKLDSITNKNGNIKYSVALFGELGDFFYNLAYDDEGKEKTLADLKFGWNNENTTLFKANKDFVIDGWYKLYNDDFSETRNVATWVKAAPTYSGYYDDFDSNKILIKDDVENIKNYCPDIITKDDTKTFKNGYVLVETQRDMDEWEVSDLRASKQRYAIKTSLLLDAIAKPENNGGYSIEWDGEFSNMATQMGKYFGKSYVLLNKFEYDSTDEIATHSLVPYTQPTPIKMYEGYTTLLKDAETSQYVFDVSNYLSASVNVNFNLSIVAGIGNIENLYTSYYRQTMESNDYTVVGGYLTKLSVISNGEVVASSPYNLYSTKCVRPGNHQELNINGLFPNYKDVISKQMGIDANDINFVEIALQKVMLDKFRVSDNLTISCKIPMGLSDVSFKLEIKPISVNNAKTTIAPNFASEIGGIFVQTPNCQTKMEIYGIKTGFGESDVISDLKPPIVNKQVLLGSTCTPLAFLLSFVKLFGLKCYADKGKKVIHIVQRKNYYKNTVVDFDDKIDRAKDIKITPTLINYKFYEYGIEPPDTYANMIYNKKNDLQYGAMRYSTNYNFSKETKNILEGNVFKNIIPYRLGSIYFNNPYPFPSLFLSPTYTYTVWSIFTGEAEERKMNGLGASGLVYKRYDPHPKLCCFDQSNENLDDIALALVFYDGVDEYAKGIQISDNTGDMVELNGNLCYVINAHDTTTSKIVHNIPRFSKYLTNENGNYIASLDFEKPSYSFIGDLENYSNDCTLVSGFWLPYLDDIYNKDCKKVELYCLINEQPTEAMRKFYAFDNSIWVLNKINDYSPNGKLPLKCEFIKVNEIKNYLI